MPVFCKNCKKENIDPHMNLPWSSCQFCGGTLVRSTGIGRLVGAGTGAMIGSVGGPVGAVVGGVLGFFLGDAAEKNIKR